VSFADEAERCVLLIEKMVNSPVEKKDAIWMCPEDGGDWSRASAVIRHVLSLPWDSQYSVCFVPRGLNISMVGWSDGWEEAVITNEPARRMCGWYGCL
jgi:hypothetical protein